MKFDWSDYFNLAQELAGTSEDAKLRSAVSRAYYSVFCLARNYLRDIQQDTQLSDNEIHKINSHKYVREKFKNQSKSQTMREIGEDLNRLRKTRNQADYADNFSNLQREAKTALMLAQNIIPHIPQMWVRFFYQL